MLYQGMRLRRDASFSSNIQPLIMTSGYEAGPVRQAVRCPQWDSPASQLISHLAFLGF